MKLGVFMRMQSTTKAINIDMHGEKGDGARHYFTQHRL
jgi:hypothetical protein